MRQILAVVASLLLQSAFAEEYSNPIEYLSPASCGHTCVIFESGGGYVLQHRLAAFMMAANDQYLVIDGPCASACTILVDLLSVTDNVCLTDRADLGIHMMRSPAITDEGREFTRYEPIPYYSETIRSFVESKGGQPRQTLLHVPNDVAIEAYGRCEATLEAEVARLRPSSTD